MGAFTFAKVNTVTIRIDSANKRGAGWLMEVAWSGDARQRWVARVGNQASEPLPLEEAKKAARAMLLERKKAEPHDWIAELNQIAANEVDRVAIRRERRSEGSKWPTDLMGGRQRGALDPDLRRTILDTELDDYLLT